ILGEKYIVVDVDNKKIYLGKPVGKKDVGEGQVVDLGNGYAVKVKSVLVGLNNTNPKVTIQILKDGNVIYEETKQIPFKIVKDGVGVIGIGAYKNVAGTIGYASLIIAKDVKPYEIGKDFTNDWKLYAITLNGNLTLSSKDFSANRDSNTWNITIDNCPVVGLALKYEGDKIDNLGDGDEVYFPNDYAYIKFTNEDTENNLYAKYGSEISKDLELGIGESGEVSNVNVKLDSIEAMAIKPCPVSTPIAKLDTEISLDNADKNLVLIGGPVANKLTKELVDMGKINITNESPATIAVIPNVANGHDVVVVAGGNRYKTREAAEKLIEILASE
ncbi:S-layer protein, partial [Methanocaldococcus infernus]